MVSSGQGVWVACQYSSKVSLFHATTYEFLLEVNIAQAVAQKLQCEYGCWCFVLHESLCLLVSLLFCIVSLLAERFQEPSHFGNFALCIYSI
jgi:hypothetical protein